MEIDSRIEKIVKKARNRICTVKFLKAIIPIMIIGLTVWGIFQIISLFVPFYGATVFGILACMLVILVGVIVTIIRNPSKKQAALQLDSKGLDERITTSLGLKGKKDTFSMLQKNDAYARAQKISLKKAFPVRIKGRFFVMLFLSLMLVVSTGLMPAKSKDLAQEIHIVKQEIRQAEEELEDLAEELEIKHEFTESELKKIDELLEEAKTELQECENATEIEKVKERFENKMYDLAGEQAPSNNQRDAMAIENALEKVNDGKQSIESQKNIAEALDKLAEKNQDEELKDLADKMQNEINQNGQISQSTIDETQNKLQPYVQDPFYQGPQGQQGGQQGQQGGDQGQQGGQQGQQGQQGGQQGQQGQQGGQQGQQGGQQGQQGGQQGQQGQQGGQDQGQQGGQQGQQGQQGGQQGGGDQGQQGGQQGGQQSGGQGGSDSWYNGSKVGKESPYVDNGKEQIMVDEYMDPNQNLTGQANKEGSSTMTQAGQGYAWSGQKKDYNQVIGNYKNHAYDRMNKSQIPDSMKDMVKDYFTDLD